MISVKEFIETDCNNIIDDLWERYNVQRDSSGSQYLISPFDSLEDILDQFENGLNDPWDDLENDGVWSEEAAFIEECKANITKAYQEVLERRKQFAAKHELNNYM